MQGLFLDAFNVSECAATACYILAV